MKKLILIKYILILLGVTPILASCNSWLEVNPNDRIMEDDVFSTRKNFLATLNGVYLELASSDLYGTNLSFGMIDVMGQYYNVSGDHPYTAFSTFGYANASVKNRMDKIWTKSYNLIVNCNTIIEKCGDANAILGETLHPIVKGEAYALRAMLHLDILRLFGPIYRDNKDKQSIPYMTSSAPLLFPLESAESIMSKILEDLETAKELLANDPIITEGARNYDEPLGENDLYYRQYRLNYYAVKALLARAHLWAGNKTEAMKYATEVIDECQKPIAEEEEEDTQIFPFVSEENATHATYPDRVFSSEVIFATYNITRNNLFTKNFHYSLSSTAILNFFGELTDGRIPELYTDQNDYRYKMWGVETIKNKQVNYLRKFEEVNGDSYWSTEAYRYMMPLIRISEMYLIAAECTTSANDAVEKYLNKIRRARKCLDFGVSTPDVLEKNIVEEYRRETICEGQMFFVYKRLGYRNIPDCAKKTGNKNMELGSYVVPLPDSEISQRTDYVK